MLEKFAHVFPAMVTPMKEDGSFNYEVAKKHADWMMDNGIGGIGVLMAAGEYQSMSLEEHMEYVNEMVPYVKKRGASVIVGCSRERVEDACALMNNAYKAGADAAMVLPSFYYNQSQEEIIDHYTYLNDNSDLDIMVYNNPNVTSGITRETMKELYKLPHVKIVKDASMVIDVMTDFIFEAEQAKEEKEKKAAAKAEQEAAKAADMIITTGGVSVGKKDIMHESLRLMGAERIFWRVKMKPGMPTLFSAYKKTSDITATDHCASEREIPIISLSGNPFGVAVSIELLIRPALEKMMQDPSIGLKEVNGIMADNFEKGIKGRRFIRAYLENGKFHLPNGLHSNGVLSSMAGCNCLIDTKTMENQESSSLNAGDKVGAILL